MGKISTEERSRRLRQRWVDAPRGEDGLKRIRWGDFEDVPAHRADEYLTEPIVITADGEDAAVAMSIEDFYSYRKSNPKGKMVRVEGVLYREIL